MTKDERNLLLALADLALAQADYNNYKHKDPADVFDLNEMERLKNRIDVLLSEIKSLRKRIDFNSRANH